MSATAIKLPQTHDAASPLPSHAPRVLVADDDRDMCQLVEVGLRERGYRVGWRLDPEAALHELEQEDYQALVVDIHMDGKSGLDLCRAALAKRPDLPVIVMTGFGTVEHAVGAIRAGAYDFVTKPLKRAHVVRIVKNALEKQNLIV